VRFRLQTSPDETLYECESDNKQTETEINQTIQAKFNTVIKN